MKMGTEVYMSIIGLLILIIHRAALLITFPNRFKLRYTIAILLIALVLTNQFRNVMGDIIHWNALTTLFNCILMCWLLKGSVSKIFFAFYFQYILTISMLYLSEAIIGIIISPGSERFTLVLFIIMLILYTVFVTIAVKYGKKLFQRLLEQGRTTEWVLYAFGAVYSFIFLTVSRDFPGSTMQYIMSTLFVIWSFVVFCFAIINAHERTKQRYEAEFAREVISSGRDHYQNMDELHEKLRILRHDYKYHLSAAREMLDSGDTDGADEYLTDVEKQLYEHELKNYCPNPVINALVARYEERCKKLNIEFTVDIIILKTLKVPNYELCIIVGNLLENAVEACEKLDSNRKIKLAAEETTAQFMLMVENSFNGVICRDEDRPVSIKTNGGVGLRSVKTVAARYGGDLFTEWNNDTFAAYVTLLL